MISEFWSKGGGELESATWFTSITPTPHPRLRRNIPKALQSRKMFLMPWFSMFAFRARSIIISTSCNLLNIQGQSSRWDPPTCVTDPTGDSHASRLRSVGSCLAGSSHTLHRGWLHTCSETSQHATPGVFPRAWWGQCWPTKPRNMEPSRQGRLCDLGLPRSRIRHGSEHLQDNG